MKQQFGPIRQLGYVVRDIEASMRYWTEQLGVGPFFYYDRAPMRDFKYLGQPCDAQISAALGQSGPLQIELLQPPGLFNAFGLADLSPKCNTRGGNWITRPGWGFPARKMSDSWAATRSGGCRGCIRSVAGTAVRGS